MAAVDGGLTVDTPTMIRIVSRLKSSVVLPMHWFSRFSLETFLEGVSGEFAIERGPASPQWMYLCAPFRDARQWWSLSQDFCGWTTATIDTRQQSRHRRAMLNTFDETTAEHLSKAVPDVPIKLAEQRLHRRTARQISGQQQLRRGATLDRRCCARCKGANNIKFGILPYGGGTGLVGGQVSLTDPLPCFYQWKT